MSTRWSQAALALAGVAVGAVLLALAFRGTPVAVVGRTLEAGHWGGPALTVLAGTFTFVVAKTVRWRLLLGGVRTVPFAGLMRPVLAGLALNAIVPHTGEFVRAVSLQRRHAVPAPGVLSSIVAERVFDLFGVLIIGGLALWLVPTSAAIASTVRLLGFVAGVGAAGIVLALAAPAFFADAVGLVARGLPVRAGDWLRVQVAAALAGFEPVRSVSVSLRVLAWSLVQWLAIALCVTGCAAVIGFELPLAAPGLVVVGLVVAFLLPNAPGYTGSVQVVFVAALTPLGIGVAPALAASVVYQLLMVLPTIVLGLACLGSSLRRSDGSPNTA